MFRLLDNPLTLSHSIYVLFQPIHKKIINERPNANGYMLVSANNVRRYPYIYPHCFYS